MSYTIDWKRRRRSMYNIPGITGIPRNYYFEHGLTNCCDLKVSGLMFSCDDKYISTGEEIRNDDYTLSSSDFQRISSCDINVASNTQSQHFNKVLRFPIDPKAFEHIDNLRLLDENKDVFLNFLFKIIFVEHNFDLSVKNTVTLRDTNQSLGKVNLFRMKELREKKNRHKISLSDWINKYMNPLGFGNIMLFEINQPTLDNLSNFNSTDVDVPRFKERIGAAISSLSMMQDYIKKGEWNQISEQLRDIELFKADMKKDLKTLLGITTNLPEDKCEHFTTALDNLYNFSSQFHHSVDKGKLNPKVNVNKEDAYFIYMFMLSITQLFIKKIDYLRRQSTLPG
jgi:hypothetical protein